MLDVDTQAAVNSPADGSPAFTAEVQRLGSALEAVLGVSLEHGSDMCTALDDRRYRGKAGQRRFAVPSRGDTAVLRSSGTPMGSSIDV
jgi:hypothetical protein